MAVDAREMIDKLPPERRRRIRERAAEIKAEEATWRRLQEARGDVAGRLKVQAATVSRLERRMDDYLDALRDSIATMGGELEIVVRFPGQAVRIDRFADGAEERRTDADGPDAPSASPRRSRTS